MKLICFGSTKFDCDVVPIARVSLRVSVASRSFGRPIELEVLIEVAGEKEPTLTKRFADLRNLSGLCGGGCMSMRN